MTLEAPPPEQGKQTFLILLTLSTGLMPLFFQAEARYGLAPADGLMRWLEEKGIGWPAGAGVVSYRTGCSTFLIRADSDVNSLNILLLNSAEKQQRTFLQDPSRWVM